MEDPAPSLCLPLSLGGREEERREGGLRRQVQHSDMRSGHPSAKRLFLTLKLKLSRVQLLSFTLSSVSVESLHQKANSKKEAFMALREVPEEILTCLKSRTASWQCGTGTSQLPLLCFAWQCSLGRPGQLCPSTLAFSQQSSFATLPQGRQTQGLPNAANSYFKKCIRLQIKIPGST